MKKFGLICEGPTDKPVIKNTLKGYFSINNPNRYIFELQPPADITDGGWRNLLLYLSSERFQDDIENQDFVVIQIDTDVSHDFGVIHHDNNGNVLTTENLIEKVIAFLISKINEKEQTAYAYYADKIIFAISVHSIECWLVAYYVEETETDKYSCKAILQETKLPDRIQFSKKIRSRCHEKLSEVFTDKNTIQTVAQKDPSFNHFIGQLQTITLN